MRCYEKHSCKSARTDFFVPTRAQILIRSTQAIWRNSFHFVIMGCSLTFTVTYLPLLWDMSTFAYHWKGRLNVWRRADFRKELEMYSESTEDLRVKVIKSLPLQRGIQENGKSPLLWNANNMPKSEQIIQTWQFYLLYFAKMLKECTLFKSWKCITR